MAILVSISELNSAPPAATSQNAGTIFSDAF
jgi:hypothetical protein